MIAAILPLTEEILTLYASGCFGVQEAITAVTAMKEVGLQGQYADSAAVPSRQAQGERGKR